MFIVKPMFPSEWQLAMFALSYYNVKVSLISDGENPLSTYMVVEAGPAKELKVDSDKDDSDLTLAEMAFQLNWRQGPSLCPACEDNESHNGHCCGHLTFTSVIDSTEFDRLFS